MKRILFNATHAEELRVAIVDGQKLLDLDIESAIRSERKGNIYKAVITKIEPSLEACFVNYGAERHGFLPLKEIYRGYFNNYDGQTAYQDIKINEVLKEGQELIVQVSKDERGNKGAALSTFISLAGRFMVLMPNNPKGGGISRRIMGDERRELKHILSSLEVSNQHSLIARTAAIGRSQDELQWDLDFLNRLWDTIEKASTLQKAPYLIYQESNLVVRSIRDHLSNSISELVIDNEEIYNRAKQFIEQVMPHNLKKIRLYQDSIPLFSRYQVENQIASAFNREVQLPSGGALIIDQTEALISIDVNSARATKGGDIEETAFKTNLQAVEEVARQLRIRDLGGLVVIDLIDMSSQEHQKAVEKRFQDALKPDRARVKVGHISSFGLLEMSRQRLRSSISEANYHICPRCDGTGIIRNVVSSSLNLLRLIEEEAQKENTEAIQVSVPLDMSTYILNEKRYELSQLESRLGSRIIMIPSHDLVSPKFNIRRLRADEIEQISSRPSYQQKIETENDSDPNALPESLKTVVNETPQIHFEAINHETPPPVSTSKRKSRHQSDNTSPDKKPGILSTMFSFFFGTKSEAETAEKSRQQQSRKNTRTRSPNNKRTDNRTKKKTSTRSDNNKPRNTRQSKKTPSKRNTGHNKTNAQTQPQAGEKTTQAHQKRRPTKKSPAKKTNHSRTNEAASKPSVDQTAARTTENVNPSAAKSSPQESIKAETMQTSNKVNTAPQRKPGQLSRTIRPATNKTDDQSQSTQTSKPKENTADNTGGPSQQQEVKGESAQNKPTKRKVQSRRKNTPYSTRTRRKSDGDKKNNTKVKGHENNKHPSDTTRIDFSSEQYESLPDDIGNRK